MRVDPRRTALVATTLACSMGVAACGSQADPDRPAAHEPSATTTSTAPTSTAPTSGGPSDVPTTEDTMRIRITMGDQRFSATLHDSAAAGDLLAQLPVTVDMTDHGGLEKTGPLPSPLSLDGQPDGADPDVGDVGYYVPGNDLVLYYGDQSFFPGIVVLGRLDGDAPARIGAIDGAVTATVQAG